MSIQAAQPNIAFKKPKPGLAKSGSMTNNLKVALGGIKASSQTNTASNTASTTGAAPRSLETKSSVALFAANSLSSTSSASNIFREAYKGGQYFNPSSPQPGGTINVNPSHYFTKNTKVYVPGELSGYVGPTPRGEARQNRMLEKYMQAQMNMANAAMDQQKCRDIAATFNTAASIVSNLGGHVAGLFTQNAATKSQTAADAAINQLKQADTTSELSAGIGELNTQNQELETTINSLTQSIQESNQDIKAKEAELNNNNAQISTKQQQLTGINSTITKLESSIAADKRELERLTNSLKLTEGGSIAQMGVQNQINQLNQKIEQDEKNLETANNNKQQLETDIKDLKTANEEISTVINNTKESLETETQQLETAKKQKTEVEENITKYNKKLTKETQDEAEQLSRLESDLAEMAKEYETETDPDKKAKLQKKFDKTAAEYNAIVGSTTVTGHSAITFSLGDQK